MVARKLWVAADAVIVAHNPHNLYSSWIASLHWLFPCRWKLVGMSPPDPEEEIVFIFSRASGELEGEETCAWQRPMHVIVVSSDGDGLI